MNDSELQIFAEGLCASNYKNFVNKIRSVVDKKLFKLLQQKSKFSLDRWRLVGGLEKKTSTLVKVDADIVVFYNEDGAKRKDVIDDFQNILLLNTSLNEEDIVISSNEVMQFLIDGIPIDLVIAKNNVDKGSNENVIESQRKNSLREMKKSGSYSDDIADVDLSFQLAESSVEFMKKQSKFVHDMARLGKYWNQVILFKEHVHGRSMIFELLGAKAAMEEEEKHDNPSLSRAFCNFLSMVCNIRKQNIRFHEYYEQCHIPAEISRQRPCLMDPINPYNNLLDVNKRSNLEKLFAVFEQAAAYVLRMIEDGCKDISLIFYPQPLLYILRKKENWFLPQDRTYLVGINNSTEKWIHKLTSGIVMPAYKCRDTKGEHLESDFTAVLYSLACFIYNLTGPLLPTESMLSDQEMLDAVENFIDKADGVKRNWVKGNGNHETKGVTFVVPYGLPLSNGSFKVVCISLDFYSVTR